MKTRKLTVTESQMLNSIRKFIVSLKGTATKGIFCFSQEIDCSKCKCRNTKCYNFYKSSLTKINWNPDILTDLLSGKSRLVISNGDHDHNMFIDLYKKQWWKGEGYKHEYWTNQLEIWPKKKIGDFDIQFIERFEKNIVFLMNDFEKYFHKERGRIHSRDFGI